MGPEADPADGGGDIFCYIYSVCNVDEYEDVGGGESVAGYSGWGLNIVG